MQLGTSNVKALMLSLHVFDAYNRLHFPEISVKSLWLHSWETAQLAHKLCKEQLGEDAANAALFAGLVHDLGCLILMENQPDRYREVCRTAIRESKPLVEVEKEAFGVAHTDLSGFMLRLWGLPQQVIDAVTYCDAPWQGTNNARFNPTVALYMANTLTRQQNPPDQFNTPELNRDYLISVGAPAADRQSESKRAGQP